MSVQAFKFYNQAKHHLGKRTIDLAGSNNSFDLHLFKSTSNFATATLSTYGSLTNQIASAGGYTLAGKALSSITWTAGSSAGQQKFNFKAVSHSASANITSILAYVVVARTGASAKDSANKLLGYASLTSAVFSVSSGNKLTLTPPSTGIFTLA